MKYGLNSVLWYGRIMYNRVKRKFYPPVLYTAQTVLWLKFVDFVCVQPIYFPPQRRKTWRCRFILLRIGLIGLWSRLLVCSLLRSADLSYRSLAFCLSYLFPSLFFFYLSMPLWGLYISMCVYHLTIQLNIEMKIINKEENNYHKKDISFSVSFSLSFFHTYTLRCVVFIVNPVEQLLV